MSSVYISHAGSHSFRPALTRDYRQMRSWEKHFNVCWNDTRVTSHTVNLEERYVLHLKHTTPWSELHTSNKKESLLIFYSFLGLERNRCAVYRQQTHRSEKDQKHPKSPSLKSPLKFCFKVRTIFRICLICCFNNSLINLISPCKVQFVWYPNDIGRSKV